MNRGLRALENHPKVVPWEIEVQFYNIWGPRALVKVNFVEGLQPILYSAKFMIPP